MEIKHKILDALCEEPTSLKKRLFTLSTTVGKSQIFRQSEYVTKKLAAY
jgi:hypothetical protein